MVRNTDNAHSFPVVVISPDGELFREEAVSIVVPAIDGYLGVMKNHMPMITVLDFGELLIRTLDERILAIAVAGGFMEVRRGETIILCDYAEFREDIDIVRATQAEERAREKLSKRLEGINVERAEVALRKARNRVRVAQRKERKQLIE
ncbi:MAG: ATP synthase F1 subunit epsilon [Candidatus Riflebacteria bacterium RBG_13_59_9]|nr:MAG: ATP synthase F1 subunit epsilon [Candidatus Riflebacteria bacterium RBG_13_59_9]